MAKVKFSALVSDARNSVGNTTFTKGRYGNVARSKVAPIQPRTARQLTVRAAFSSNAKGWDSLSDAQRAAWVAFANSHPISDVFGDSRILAGNAAYVQVNATRALVGLTPVNSPPATGGLAPAADSAAAAVGSTGIVTITTASQTVSTGFYLIHTTPGLNAGAYFAGSKSRIAGFAATTGSATTATATPATYNPKLGFTAGQTVLVRVARVDINGYVVASTAYRIVAS